MSDQRNEDAEHVFDQTNGALGEPTDDVEPEQLSERDRRRRAAAGVALGFISTGHN